MFNQLINSINNLPSGTNFSITQDWLNANGINATANDAISLGKQFAKVYSNYNCSLVSKGSDNLKMYKKN